MIHRGYVLVNFGGPRDLDEVESFLKTLLCDQDVVRTPFPQIIHNLLFKRIAKKRSQKVSRDYKEIGGCSPIYEDTQAVCAALQKVLKGPCLTFHRYLPKTHKAFISKIQQLNCIDEWVVFPFFPQFTYATTGSIARFFAKNLSQEICSKMRWIKSYPDHPRFLSVWKSLIQEEIKRYSLKENEVILLFSAHGIPHKFREQGDLYYDECQRTFRGIAKEFPKALCRLCFQSKFGPGAWLKPYTEDQCKIIKNWSRERRNVFFVPISFTSDHIETLFEIEKEYLPIIKENGLKAYRVPAMNRRQDWIEAILEIIHETLPVNTQMLIRSN